LKLEDQAAMVGAYRWVEGRLFEVLGGWVVDEEIPLARIEFDEQSQAHAWHAELFWDRLPVLDWVDREALSVAPSKEVSNLFFEISELTHSLARLVLLSRLVLPRLVAGYRLHLERAVPVSDTPLIRALRLVLSDELEHLKRVEALLEALLEGKQEEAPEEAAAYRLVGSSEEVLGSGGPGLVSWPASEPRRAGRERGLDGTAKAVSGPEFGTVGDRRA
jgi:hypothetical protein